MLYFYVRFLVLSRLQFYPSCSGSLVMSPSDWIQKYVGAASRHSAVASEARAPSLSKVDGIGPFRPHLDHGYFGCTCLEWEGRSAGREGKRMVNLAGCQHYYGEESCQRISFFFFTFNASLQHIALSQHFLALRSLLTFHFLQVSTERVAPRVTESQHAVGFLHYIFERRKKTGVRMCVCSLRSCVYGLQEKKKKKSLYLTERSQDSQITSVSALWRNNELYMLSPAHLYGSLVSCVCFGMVDIYGNCNVATSWLMLPNTLLRTRKLSILI